MQPEITTTLGTPTLSAVLFFFVIVALTLAVTWWAARRTHSTSEFYAAGRSVGPFENGLALAGDYMSAASFLGIAGLVALRGYDGMIYATGWLVGWPALMFLLAEPVRNLGKYTFADVVAFRLRQVPVRVASAFGGILTVLFYTIAQMVGAGNLIRLLFGIPYEWAVTGVGLVMLAYVLFGGMIATTWVQIIKAVLLLFGVTPARLYAAVAERYGQSALEPGGLVADPLDAVSLGLALMLGLLGLPHILMRFYTVPDARAARASVLCATGLIGYFYLIIPIVGFGASALVGRDLIARVDAGGNMAAPLVAELLGGTPFLGFIVAVAFATILAVVAGLTLASSSSFSHDLYANVIRNGEATEQEEVKVAKIAAFGIGSVAIVLSLFAQDLNIAFLVALAFAVAASANLPSILLNLFWPRFNTRGATWAIYGGLIVCVGLIIFSPNVSGSPTALFDNNDWSYFPLKNPGIISIPAGFLFGIIGTLTSKEPEAIEKFKKFEFRALTGAGAEKAVQH
jgi:cation/acetate symporter